MPLRVPFWCCALLLLTLAACSDGGGAGSGIVPEAPTEVHASHNTRPVIVSWRHDGSNAAAYVVYRGLEDGSAPPVEVGREPKSDAKKVYTFRHAEAGDDSRYRYGVAAASGAGTSVIVWNDASQPVVAAASCEVHDISVDDLDGDGIPNEEEYEGWDILVAPLTASAVGVAGQLQRDKPTSRSVSSSMFYADTDGDGLCDLQEHAQTGTDPSNVDTDEDGLDDYAEVITWNSNPSDPDSDDDAFAPVLAVIDGEQQVQYVTLASADPTLLDGRETCASSGLPCGFKTSPTLADTDGDSYTDYDEIIRLGSPFNPLVADLPQLELSLVGTAGLTVDIAYSDSTQQAQTKTTGLASSQSDSNTNYNSTVRKTWDKYGQSVSAGYKSGLFPSYTVNVSASFEEGTATTTTSGWSGTTTNQSTQTYNDAVQTASQAGRQISGGSISMGVQIRNTGEISYNLTDLAVTALQHLPAENSFSSVATLLLANPLGADPSFASIGAQLLASGSGISLAPGDSTGVLQVKADLAAGNKILDLMANPASLYFDIGTFGITNAQNIDFNFIDQITNAQTGLVLIDFGGGSVLSKRVATNVNRVNGAIVGIPLGEAMTALGINYETEPRVVDGQTINVLSGVQNPATGQFVRVDSTNNRFWVALKTAQAFAALPQNFEDIVLQAGGAMYLLFVTDADQDGVYLRDESLYGTSDANTDSDGDGLGDFDEIAQGWQVTATLPPRYPVQVFSNPAVPDADNDGLSDTQEKAAGTDPNNPDTDNDLLCDGPGSAVNAGGICRSGVQPDPQPLVPRFAFIGATPSPNTFGAATSAPIVINFSLPVRGTSAVRVRSLTRGPVKGTVAFSDGGRTLTFTPQQPFMANEVIDVSLSGETSEDSGALLPDYHYAFTVASPPSNSSFAGQGTAGLVSDDPGFRINAVVSGDFNQDNLLDIAMTGFNPQSGGNPSGDAIYVAFGSGQADFNQPVPIAFAGVGPQALVAGDFNNDGRLDLAATLVKDASVAVLLASATQGQFDPPSASSYITVGVKPVGIATGDLNGDGNLDLVTVNNDDDSANTILLGKGDGTFTVGHPLVSGPAPQAIAVADIDSDGFLDTITPFGSSPGTGGVTVRLGIGDGTFRQTGVAQPFTATGFPVAVATGDFNGDGLLDFVTANQGSGDVSLLLNNGNGSFTPQANIPVASDPTDIITGDFNGDGKLDIATSSAAPSGQTGGGATVLYGQANVGSFERQDQQISLRGTALVADKFQNSPDNAPLSLVVLGFDNPSNYQYTIIGQGSGASPP